MSMVEQWRGSCNARNGYKDSGYVRVKNAEGVLRQGMPASVGRRGAGPTGGGTRGGAEGEGPLENIAMH